MSVFVRKVLVTTAALCVLPTAAYAVNVSSNAGSGDQHRTRSYTNGADVSGTLRSTTGRSVYYSGIIDLGNACSDDTVGRYSSNTTSTRGVTRGGSITILKPRWCSFQGVRSRVCEDRPASPDSCGAWSTRY